MLDRIPVPRIGVASVTVAAFLLFSTAIPARADYPDYVKSACKRDFKSFCPKYDINSTALRQCIRSVVNELSPRCVEALEKSGERRKR